MGHCYEGWDGKGYSKVYNQELPAVPQGPRALWVSQHHPTPDAGLMMLWINTTDRSKRDLPQEEEKLESTKTTEGKERRKSPKHTYPHLYRNEVEISRPTPHPADLSACSRRRYFRIGHETTSSGTGNPGEWEGSERRTK